MALTFLFPTVLAAGAAAAAPIIIHLIMRTRPRRVVFPPLRFVRTSHRAQISKLRLKHLLLLAMRVAAILLIAALIARAQIPGWRQVADQAAPAAAVVVADTSGSMDYRWRGASLLSAGKKLAREVVESLPAGSRVAVVATGAPTAAAPFLGDLKLAGEQVAAVEQGCGEETLEAALARAAALLEEAELTRKEIYVVSDMTRRSWRPVLTGAERALPPGVRLTVLRCGEDARPNVALGEARPEASEVPAGTEVAVETSLTASQTAGEFIVRAELDGEAVAQEAVSLAAGGSTPVRLTVRAAAPGIRQGRLVLQPPDGLDMDNVRYFTLAVGEPGQVVVVRDAATVGRGDETSFLMAHAVAPPGAAAAGGVWVRRQTLTPDRLTEEALKPARIVLLANVSALSAEQWKLLEDFVRRGGRLWVVIGELTSAAGYAAARQLLPAPLKALEDPPAPTGWKPAAGHALLEPFADQPNPPLAEVLCKRRFALADPAEGAQVVLRYADGVPAILTRPAGQGATVLWNFSPARAFSNLAGLAQFPILAQRTVRLLLGGEGAERSYTLGQAAAVPIPASMPAATATIRPPGGAGLTVATDGKKRSLTVPADRVGHWAVEFAYDQSQAFDGFSVNASPAESDLETLAGDEIVAAFGEDRAVVVAEAGELERHRRMVAQPLDLAAPLLLALLALLVGESFFANRFYRTADAAPAGS